MKIKCREFGQLPDGRPVLEYSLSNGSMSMGILNYGGVIRTLEVPDRNKVPENVVLGLNRLEDFYCDAYKNNDPYFGAIIGRVSNRIGGASFTLNGSEYKLENNEGNNILHGGYEGFDKKIWSVTASESSHGGTLDLFYRSPDGEEGFPGNMDINVRYELSRNNTLTIIYRASTDKDTLVSLTNHSYFNLSGNPASDIRDHRLFLNGGQYCEIGDEYLPTGKIIDVDHKDMDFRECREIGLMLKKPGNHRDIGCFAHTWILNKNKSAQPAARVEHPASGRTLEIRTTEPGMLFYSGEGLDGSLGRSEDETFGKWSGLCLEPQQIPDAIHHKSFPQNILKAGEEFFSTSEYRFGIMENQ